MVERPLSMREVPGSIPRFSMRELVFFLLVYNGSYAWSPAVYYSKMKRKCAQHVFLNGTFLNDELVSSIAETEIITTSFILV